MVIGLGDIAQWWRPFLICSITDCFCDLVGGLSPYIWIFRVHISINANSPVCIKYTLNMYMQPLNKTSRLLLTCSTCIYLFTSYTVCPFQTFKLHSLFLLQCISVTLWSGTSDEKCSLANSGILYTMCDYTFAVYLHKLAKLNYLFCVIWPFLRM